MDPNSGQLIPLKGLGRDLLLKLPSHLKIESKPLEAESFQQCDRGRMKQEIENTIRWRKVVDEHGKERLESNAKIVKWKNGTMSLRIGKKVFDMCKLHTLDNSEARGFNNNCDRNGNRAKTVVSFFPNPKDPLPVIRQRPVTMRSHQEFVANRIKQKKLKDDGTKKTMLVPVLNRIEPEQERREKIRQESERLRALNRRENYRRKLQTQIVERRMSSNFLEGRNSDDDLESPAAIKRGYTDIARYGGAYSSGGEYESDLEQNLNNAKLESSDESDVESHDKEKLSGKKRIIEEEED